MVKDRQFVAWDFMGLGKMGDVKKPIESKDGGMPLKLHEVNLGHRSGAAASINNSTFLNNMAFAGLKHPLGSNAATVQQLFSLGNFHQEKLIEQSAESASERTYTPPPHPVQAWLRGDPSVKHFPVAGDDVGPNTQTVGAFGRLLPKNAQALPIQSSHPPAGFSEIVQRVSAPEPTEMKDSAPLTIFYGGNVIVFNDITAEKAQAVMFLASFGNLQGLSSAGVANTTPVNMAMPSSNMLCPSVANKAIRSPSVVNVSQINVPSRIQMDLRNGFNVDQNSQAAPSEAGFRSAIMQLDLGCPGVPAPLTQEQLVVPTALPQARKASLARFLEKRRERVLSRSPYPSMQADSSLPEERFSSSNDIAPYGSHSTNDEKQKITRSCSGGLPT
ncbi:hypothetical protein L7F22_069236 [Adiantum nelumboides]|nr:hypothetical protein [Adiantum nelumboides]